MHAVVHLVDRGGRWRRVYSWNHICSVGIQHYARVVIVLHQNSEGIFRKSILVCMEAVREFSIQWVIIIKSLTKYSTLNWRMRWLYDWFYPQTLRYFERQCNLRVQEASQRRWKFLSFENPKHQDLILISNFARPMQQCHHLHDHHFMQDHLCPGWNNTTQRVSKKILKTHVITSIHQTFMVQSNDEVINRFFFVAWGTTAVTVLWCPEN